MIQLCKDDKKFLEICDKLELVTSPKLTQQVLYNYMIAGLFEDKVYTYVSDDNGVMNGCTVLLLTRDILGEITLGMLFTWIDAHYPKIHEDFINIATTKAKELGAAKISFTTNRKEKIINRRFAKHGFTKACSTYEKRIKEVI